MTEPIKLPGNFPPAAGVRFEGHNLASNCGNLASNCRRPLPLQKKRRIILWGRLFFDPVRMSLPPRTVRLSQINATEINKIVRAVVEQALGLASQSLPTAAHPELPASRPAGSVQPASPPDQPQPIKPRSSP